MNIAQIAKFLASFLGGLVVMLQTNGVDIPAWITSDWITSFLAVVAVPVAVYLIPNKT